MGTRVKLCLDSKRSQIMADLAKVNAEVMKSAGEIFRLCQEWNKLSKEMQQETASTMVQHFKDLSDNFRIMLENDPNGSKESTKPIQDLGNHLMDILNIVSSSEVPETVTIDSVSESPGRGHRSQRRVEEKAG